MSLPFVVARHGAGPDRLVGQSVAENRHLARRLAHVPKEHTLRGAQTHRLSFKWVRPNEVAAYVGTAKCGSESHLQDAVQRLSVTRSDHHAEVTNRRKKKVRPTRFE